MTLLSAFATLLHRYSGQADIVVGSPIAGRSRSEIEKLIGFFVSTLVLRTSFAEGMSFRELLSQVRESTLEAYAHQDAPFEKLVEILQPERDPSRTPLFQVWFNFVNLGKRQLSLHDLQVETFSINNKPSARFDLTLYVREGEQGLTVQWVYNRNLFEESTIAFMSSSFETLLKGIVCDPEQAIASLPLLTTDQQQQLSAPHNSTEGSTQFPHTEIEQSIPSRFASQVSRHRERLAIKTGQYEWTYGELNATAQRIAVGILSHEQQSSGQVALLFEQDAPMVAALLGTLQAGKAYVALDANYPVARLQYMLSDAQSQLLVVDNRTVELGRRLADGSVTLLNIDELQSDNSEAKLPNVSPDALAYLLYTSGSTGRPKGVMQTHRNVLHFISQQTSLLNITAGDRISLFASYSFDAAIVDIFSALLNGATLYPIDIKRQSAAQIAEQISAAQITLYHSTPTFYRSFLSQYAGQHLPNALQSIRAVILGGEAMLPSDITNYRKHFNEDCCFVNLYGSTESTISLQQVIEPSVNPLAENARVVSIGRPAIGTTVRLLNEAGGAAQVMSLGSIASPP
ncbi:MAG: AMP-binding protein, partial [Cyanobacteria bacterium J06607_13]